MPLLGGKKRHRYIVPTIKCPKHNANHLQPETGKERNTILKATLDPYKCRF
jgi:hypothetical protein